MAHHYGFAFSSVLPSLYRRPIRLSHRRRRPRRPRQQPDEFAARGQREARDIKYGDWQKLCFKPGGAKMVCRTTISGTFATGQTAVRVYVTEREGDSVARLQLFLPVGLYMPPGVKLSVDKGTAHKIPFTWCLTNTCIAGDAAKPALLRELEAGKSLTVEVVDTNLLAVTTSLPLGQFASGPQGRAHADVRTEYR